MYPPLDIKGRENELPKDFFVYFDKDGKEKTIPENIKFPSAEFSKIADRMEEIANIFLTKEQKQLLKEYFEWCRWA